MPQKVSTGQLTITDLMDGLNARLSNEAHLLPATSDGSVISYAGCETTMNVFQGTQDATANWEFSAISSVGVTGGFVPFQRASTATYIDGAGVLQTAGVNVPRFQGGAVLVEGAGTNVAFYSGSVHLWTKSSGGTGVLPVTTENFAAAPSGDLEATRVVFSKGSGTTSTDQSTLTTQGPGTVVGQPTCAFVYMRSNTADSYQVRVDFNGASSTDAVSYPNTVTVTPVWQRFDIRLSNSFDTGRRMTIRLRGSLGTSDYADVLIWGGQQEIAVSASSYIPTTTAPATRAADIYRPSTYAVTGLTSESGTVDITASKQGYTGITSRFSVTKAREGVGGIAAILSNESHTFPASNAGVVSSYVGSGTEIRVYEGATQLAYDGVGTANGTWRVNRNSLTNIAGGTLIDSGTFVTVGAASTFVTAADTAEIVYTITGKTVAGTVFTLNKVQTFSKSKAGTIGLDGAPGPAVMVVSDRPATFTSTDTVLDTGQADIVLTANTQGLVSPTFAWTFSGLQANPTASTTATQAITAAQFGTSKAAIATVMAQDGRNLVFNSSFEIEDGSSGDALGWFVFGSTGQTAIRSLVPSWVDSGKAQRLDFVDLNSGEYLALDTKGGYYPIVSSDQAVTMSARFRATAGLRVFIVATWRNSGGIIGVQRVSPQIAATGADQRISYVPVVNSGASYVSFSIRAFGPASGSANGFFEVDQAQVVLGEVTDEIFFGPIVDKMTIVRLERSTAAAGATVGGTIGVNIGGQITQANINAIVADNALSSAKIGKFIVSDNFDGAVDVIGDITNDGSQGWAIGKGGKAVFQDAFVRGHVVATSGTFTGEINATSGYFGGILAAGTVNVSDLVGRTLVYGNAGTFTFTAGPGETWMRVTLVGGGGRGANTWGRGGGGGGRFIGTYTVQPGQVYTVTVGRGGDNSAGAGATTVTGVGVSGAVAGRGESGNQNTGGEGGGGTTAGQAGSNGSFSVAYEPPSMGGYGAPGYYYDVYTGGRGGNSGGNLGGGGAGRSVNAGAGFAGGLYGGGGGGGAGANGGNGANGYAKIEIGNPNGVVLRSEWNNLMGALQANNIATGQ